MDYLVAMAPGHQYRGSFRGHKGDQTQQGWAIGITCDDAWGAHSGVGAICGAIALMELLSCYSILPGGASLSSYRYGSEVKVWRYTEALWALRQVVAKAGGDPSEVAVSSSRIGAAITLAAVGEVSQRMTQS